MNSVELLVFSTSDELVFSTSDELNKSDFHLFFKYIFVELNL